MKTRSFAALAALSALVVGGSTLTAADASTVSVPMDNVYGTAITIQGDAAQPVARQPYTVTAETPSGQSWSYQWTVGTVDGSCATVGGTNGQSFTVTCADANDAGALHLVAVADDGTVTQEDAPIRVQPLAAPVVVAVSGPSRLSPGEAATYTATVANASLYGDSIRFDWSTWHGLAGHVNADGSFTVTVPTNYSPDGRDGGTQYVGVHLTSPAATQVADSWGGMFAEVTPAT